MKTTRVALAFVACLSIAAHAANGVIEINHARATANPATLPGDNVGYPVQITQSGSYILTSNLNGGITITANNVTIDLNGFTITGSGVGISASAGVTNVLVKNGSVANMTSAGINLGTNSRVENVRAISNGSDGIIVLDGSTVVNSTAIGNSGKGISATTKTVLRDNVVLTNTNDNVGVLPKTFLLFPYASNAGGVETTFTISNTSSDAGILGSPPFSGTCFVTFINGANGVLTQSTSISIAAGRQITWNLTSGGNSVQPVGSPVTGHIIADCNFPLAHGVAILTGTGTSTTLPAYVIKPQRMGNYPESLGN